MVAERQWTVLGSLSGESVEHVVQRAKFSGNEEVTMTEDGDVAEDVGECENHHRDRKN